MPSALWLPSTSACTELSSRTKFEEVFRAIPVQKSLVFVIIGRLSRLCFFPRCCNLSLFLTLLDRGHEGESSKVARRRRVSVLCELLASILALWLAHQLDASQLQRGCRTQGGNTIEIGNFARKRNLKVLLETSHFAMTPTSLANRSTHKRDRLRPAPVHRRFAAIVTRLPKRARAVLALALILLVWRIAEPTTTRLKGESRSRPTVTIPSKAVRFASPHLNIPKVQVLYKDGSAQGVVARRTLEGAQKERYDSLWSPGSVQGIEGEIGIEIKLIDETGKETIVDIEVGSVCEHVDCQKIKGVRAELNLAKGLRQLRISSSFSTFCHSQLRGLTRDSHRR